MSENGEMTVEKEVHIINWEDPETNRPYDLEVYDELNQVQDNPDIVTVEDSQQNNTIKVSFQYFLVFGQNFCI